MDDGMNKRPSLQFYPGDWWRANDIKGCSMSTQGVWFNLLMAMWDSPEQGKIEMNLDSACRVIGAKTREVKRFLSENKQHKFADVTECNGIVTIINRRMYAEYLERKGTKERVQQHRKRKSNTLPTRENRQDCNANVTTPSSTSTSTSKNTYTREAFMEASILVGLTDQEAGECFNHLTTQGWRWGNDQPVTGDIREVLQRWKRQGQKVTSKKERDLSIEGL